jgi:hypothetical protein
VLKDLSVDGLKDLSFSVESQSGDPGTSRGFNSCPESQAVANTRRPCNIIAKSSGFGAKQTQTQVLAVYWQLDGYGDISQPS